MADIPLPPALILRTGATVAPPALVAELIEQLIGALDEFDGDPDIEANGDEQDGTDAEDEELLRGTRRRASRGPGCIVSDNDKGVDDDGEPGTDEEREQMLDDVPMLKVFGIEPDPATGNRPYLGRSNLSPTFLDNTAGVRCADTGRVQYRDGRRGDVR